MRNLEKQITDWREAMAKTSGCTQELLDELEEHLREEIDRLLRAGTSVEDVFAMAVSRLGGTADLQAEFAKLSASGGAWMPVKIARFLLGVTGVALFAIPLLFRDRGVLLNIHVFCVVLGYLIMFAMGGLSMIYVCARWLGSSALAQRGSLFRAMFQFANVAALLIAIGVVLGMFWAKDHLGRYWAWDLKETGAFVIFACALLISALQWIRAAQPLALILAIVGNVVTAWGWFGANAPSSWTFSNPFLVVFIASQFIFILAGAVKALAEVKDERAEN